MPKKVKVIHLARLYHPHVGGVESHVAHLATELHDRGYEIAVVTEQFSSEVPLQEKDTRLPFIEITRIPLVCVGKKLRVWWWVWQHRALFEQADILHVHDVWWWILPFSLMWRQKTWITFHGYEGTEAPSQSQVLWHKLAAWFTRGSLAVGAFHEKWYGVKSDKIVYGAVERERTGPPKLKRQHKKNFVFIGRLEADTGALQYVKAIQLLQAQGQADIQLDMFGDGSQRAKIERLIAEHSLPIKLHGFTPSASRHLANARVACVSRYLAILEALACGIPIVAQYNNLIKQDYVTMAPFADWIQIVSSPEEIATALVAPKMLPSAAKKWVVEQTWSKMADEYESLWKTNHA